MEEIIKINYETGEPKVSARDLHDGLQIRERFSTWFSRYSDVFDEKTDYTSVGKPTEVSNNGGTQIRELQDYEMTVDMAKHISMMTKTSKGKLMRQYFIDLEKAWNTPEQIIARSLKIADKILGKNKLQIEQLTKENLVKDQMIGELKPKADYTDIILKSKSLVTISQIAKDYGISGKEMNQILHEMKIQFKQNGQWLLYSRYQNKGYTHSETIHFEHTDGRHDVTMITKWTQKGRLFLYGALKKVEILPVIEQE